MKKTDAKAAAKRFAERIQAAVKQNESAVAALWASAKAQQEACRHLERMEAALSKLAACVTEPKENHWHFNIHERG